MSVAKQKKYYFLAPTRNNPPDGIIKLGNIIESTSLADSPLNAANLTISASDISIHNEYNWSSRRSRGTDGKVGIWASFLQFFVGLGGDISASWDNEKTSDIFCKQLATLEFKPSKEFIKNAVNDEEVRDFLLETDFRQGIYMIVGIKIAIGASSVLRMANVLNLKIKVGVDGTSFGIPGSAGPEFNIGRKGLDEEAFEDADPFVFAFRVRRIKVKNNGRVTDKVYTNRKAMYGLGDSGEEPENEEIDVEDEGIDDRDASADEFGMKDKEEIAIDEADEMEQEVICVKTTTT
jgi:hypothetical protein